MAAHDQGRLVGIARTIIDFAYCSLLPDLAVDVAYQRQGIGKRLIDETRTRTGGTVTPRSSAAPAAETYYPKIDMQHVASCWCYPALEVTPLIRHESCGGPPRSVS